MRVLAFFLAVISGLLGCAPTTPGEPPATKEQLAAARMDHAFPFTAMNVAGHYCAVVPLVSDSIISIYGGLFKKYGYTGSGFTWQSHINSILSKLDPALMSRLSMDPENSDFFVFMQSEKDLDRFMSLVVPVYNNLPELEGYIKNSAPEW